MAPKEPVSPPSGDAGQLNEPRQTDRLVRMRAWAERTSLSLPVLYRLLRDGYINPGFRNGRKCRQWYVRNIDAFLFSRMKARANMRRLADQVALPHWTPALERVDLPFHDIRVLPRSEVLATVGLGKSELYRRILGPGSWSLEMALREMELRKLPHVPVPAPVPLTVGRVAWVERELRQYIELCGQATRVEAGGAGRDEIWAALDGEGAD